MPLDIILVIVGAVFSAIMIGVAYQINHKEQPKQLWLLFFTEMWERFSFYGMRALLILFLVNEMKKQQAEANYQYAAYNALVYTMPLLGGWVADRILGYRKSIILGGVLMAIGHLVLAIPQEFTFYLGLGFLITGNGFFKPNISSFLGTYFTPEMESKKDAGYSIFYMGVNIGAFLGSMLCGYLGQEVNWHLGFGTAGVFMIFGLIIFLTFRKVLGDNGHAVDPEFLNKTKFVFKNEYLLYLGAFLFVPVAMYLVKFYQITSYLMIPTGILALIYIIFISFEFTKVEQQKLWAALVLIVFSLMFWSFYEQSGGSLNLMAERNVDFMVGGTKLSSAMVNNSLNPFYIIFLTPILGFMWSTLSRKNMDIPIPFKFAIAFLLIGLGYMTFYFGGVNGLATGLMPLAFFMGAYFLTTLGELFLSPIGLSMITKLSPRKMFGFMMGLWFLSSALGHKLAGFIGAQMAIPKAKPDGSVFTPIESLPIYMNGCQKIAFVSLGVFVVLAILSPFLKKWMHGVK